MSLLINLLGVAGLAGLALAVWILTGSPGWAVLAASLELIAAAYALYTHAPDDEPEPSTPPAPAAFGHQHRRGGV